MNDFQVRQDLLEIAADYATFCVLVTTAELDEPGPQILYVNSAFTRMTGYSVQDMLGKTPRILQGPDTDRSLLARLRETLLAGSDFIARTVNYRQNGDPFELEWIISHIRDANGHTTHYIAVQRDITGLSRAEHQLQEHDDELRAARGRILADAQRLRHAEQALERKREITLLGEMTAGVVHDISNALTPVFSLVETLQAMDKLPPQARRLCEVMDSSLEHSVHVLSNLKRYYHNPQGDDHADIELTALLDKLPTLTSANWRANSALQQAHYEFSITAEPDVRVKGNEIELLQVLVNIVLNAIAVMPEGGSIGIELHTEGPLAVLSITDSGPGMDPDMAARCFEPHVSGRNEGTGLGLAVCRRIVETHGGDIRVSRNSINGVTFTLRLPCLEAEHTPTSTENVLIAGGNSDDQSLISQTLRSQAEPIHITSVRTGDEALQAFFAAQFECVIIHAGIRPLSISDLTDTLRRARPGTRVFWWLSDQTQARQSLLEGTCQPDGIMRPPNLESDLKSLMRHS